MNLLEWIARNNVYTQQTGGVLKIIGVRGLDTAGAAGTCVNAGAKMHRQAIYNKANLPERTKLLQDWADLLDLFKQQASLSRGVTSRNKRESWRRKSFLVDIGQVRNQVACVGLHNFGGIR